jgi:hypothetical protein
MLINWAKGESRLLSDCDVNDDTLALLEFVPAVVDSKPVPCSAVLRIDCR